MVQATAGRTVTHRVLLDVSSLTYRAYFAMKDAGIVSPAGEPMGAVSGYLDMVARLLRSRHPDEVVHAYDHDWDRSPAPRSMPATSRSVRRNPRISRGSSRCCATCSTSPG